MIEVPPNHTIAFNRYREVSALMEKMLQVSRTSRTIPDKDLHTLVMQAIIRLQEHQVACMKVLSVEEEEAWKSSKLEDTTKP